jgi:hypothetical protein
LAGLVARLKEIVKEYNKFVRKPMERDELETGTLMKG